MGELERLQHPGECWHRRLTTISERDDSEALVGDGYPNRVAVVDAWGNDVVLALRATELERVSPG